MHRLSFRWIALVWAVGACTVALAQLPPRDLLVELRRTVDRPSTTYGSGASDAEAGFKPQTLMVRNGEKATTRLNLATPMEWTQRVESTTSMPGTATGTALPNGAQGSGAAVTKALQWMDAGQSVSITPRWPGGKRPVVIELDMRSASTLQGPGDTLPGQARSELSTTVTVPLGEWVTVARTGDAPPSGSYRSSGPGEASHWVQLRVSIP